MIIVIGAGLSGAVIAERYARLGKKVLVVEKRPHVAGNCYDFVDSNGLLIPLYGPHFFHTNSKLVWDYLNQFTRWNTYEHRVRSLVDGKLVPIPVNIETVNILFDLSIRKESEMIAWLQKHAPKIAFPKNSEESAISRVGPRLYEKMFKNYTKKQWDCYPSELYAQVLNRIPVRTNFDDRYFSDRYQAMPAEGYTAMVGNILDNKNIEVLTNTDYFEHKSEWQKFEKLFFTGRIDQFFTSIIDESLQYRSLRFEFETVDHEWYQEFTTVNYPNEESFTRITEPKRATGQKNAKTTIIREYPTWDGDPYYPVFNERNNTIFLKYQNAAKEAEKENIYFVGRLANYKYFNMDAAIENALLLFQNLEEGK